MTQMTTPAAAVATAVTPRGERETARGQALHLVIGVSPALGRPREDALPEHVAYRDDGCDLFPSCLQCPLARCRYDEPGGARALLNRARDREIRRLRLEGGLTVEAIADRFRVSRRTVFRALSAARPSARHEVA